MNIQRGAPKNEVNAGDVEVGACFLYGPEQDLHIRSCGKHNLDTHFSISVIRLRDGLENRMTSTAKVVRVGATIVIEE